MIMRQRRAARHGEGGRILNARVLLDLSVIVASLSTYLQHKQVSVCVAHADGHDQGRVTVALAQIGHGRRQCRQTAHVTRSKGHE